MATRLSTLVPLVGVGVLSFSSSACVDPPSRFDEFANRVIDAAIVEIPDAPVLTEIPDITGEFLLTIEPSNAPGHYMYMQTTIVMTKDGDAGTASLTLVGVPLKQSDRTPAGDALTTDPAVVPVSQTGEFDVGVTGTIPSSANPLGIDAGVDIVAHSRIVSEDLFCGYLTGGVVTPISTPLDNSTLAAVRIPDGSTAADVEPMWACPSGGDGDGDGDGD